MTARRLTLSRQPRIDPRQRIRALGPLPRLGLTIRRQIGRHFSVRAKLTLWYGAMCALTLAMVGFAMLWELNQRTQAHLDADLASNALLIAKELHSPVPVGKLLDAPPPCPRCSSKTLNYRGHIQQVLDDTSSALAQPGLFAQVEFIDEYVVPNHTAALQPHYHRAVTLSQAKFEGMLFSGGNHGYTTVRRRLQGGAPPEQFRVYFKVLTPPRAMDNTVAVLEVFQNEKTYIAIQHDFLLILLIGIPFGLLIALIAGWIIARGALRPIGRISRTVRAIGESRDLSRRINFIGPHDEVGRLADTFDGMMVRLEKAFETQKRFIADASHELRTPLTAIRGNADLMTMVPGDERELCLTAIRQESERMSRLVNDLLLLAEADIEEQSVHMQLIDLDDVVRDAYHSSLVLAADKVTVVLEHADPVSVCADPDRIKQLLLNLLDNAVKFTPKGGVVTLSLRTERTVARIEVADTGVGIPREEQEAIFQRFYRVEEARSKRGSGLGLAICSWIVSVHDGSIEVRSEPGKGSTFTVRLPIATAGQVSAIRPGVRAKAIPHAG